MRTIILAAALLSGATACTPFAYYSAATGVVTEIVVPTAVEGGESDYEESQTENE